MPSLLPRRSSDESESLNHINPHASVQSSGIAFLLSIPFQCIASAGEPINCPEFSSARPCVCVLWLADAAMRFIFFRYLLFAIGGDERFVRDTLFNN